MTVHKFNPVCFIQVAAAIQKAGTAYIDIWLNRIIMLLFMSVVPVKKVKQQKFELSVCLPVK